MTPTNPNAPAIYQAQQVAVFSPSKSIFDDFANLKNYEELALKFSKSTYVPAAFRNKPEECFIALEYAANMGMRPLMVMQNLVVVEGKPSWEGKFVGSVIMGCGRFHSVRYVMGNEGKINVLVTRMNGQTERVDIDNLTCYVEATDARTGHVIKGTTISMQMASAEGWLGKKGSKWQTMPEQMLQYRAASFFGRLHVQDILFGMHSADEVTDMQGGYPDAGTGAEIVPGVEVTGGNVRGQRRQGRPAPGVLTVEANLTAATDQYEGGAPTNEEDPDRMARPFGPGANTAPTGNATAEAEAKPSAPAEVPAQPTAVAPTPFIATTPNGFQLTGKHLDALVKLANNPLAAALTVEERALVRQFATAHPEYLPLPQRIGSKTELRFTQAGNEYLGEVYSAMGTPEQVAGVQVIETEPGTAEVNPEASEGGTAQADPAAAATMAVLKTPQPTPQEIRDATAKAQYGTATAAPAVPVMLGPDKEGNYHVQGSTGAFAAWPPFGDPERYRQANHPEGEDPLKDIFGH